jgi:23S rRNA (cytidine1920-2'-O)/16S rRNA (cytidine1409-2'-O)-methyltransferase
MTRARSNRPKDCPYVGKGGLKLAHAIEEFGLGIDGKTAIDLGCSTGGFTDCLLQYGAKKIYAVDTGYGVLEYKLRIDPRVVVHERTNALHWKSPEPADIIAIDLGWTPQRHSLPVARQMLTDNGHILSLLKPQYECDKSLLVNGVLPDDQLAPVVDATCAAIDDELQLLATSTSPLKGSGGNTEIWLWLQRK